MKSDKNVIAKTSSDLKPWELLSSRELFSAMPWVRVHKDKIKLPSGRIVDDYYRIQLPEYVMIYAEDDEGKVLFERQYKHALGDVTLALPTGCLEDGESPLEAGKREFLEETGYVSHDWQHIGSFMVDGNKGCGRAHFYIARKLEKISEPEEDDMEESEIVFMEHESIVQSVINGEIKLLATVAFVTLAAHPFFKGNGKQ